MVSSLIRLLLALVALFTGSIRNELWSICWACCIPYTTFRTGLSQGKVSQYPCCKGVLFRCKIEGIIHCIASKTDPKYWCVEVMCAFAYRVDLISSRIVVALLTGSV